MILTDQLSNAEVNAIHYTVERPPQSNTPSATEAQYTVHTHSFTHSHTLAKWIVELIDYLPLCSYSFETVKCFDCTSPHSAHTNTETTLVRDCLFGRNSPRNYYFTLANMPSCRLLAICTRHYCYYTIDIYFIYISVCVRNIIATSIVEPFPQQPTSKIRIDCEKKSVTAQQQQKIGYWCMRVSHSPILATASNQKNTHKWLNGWHATSIEIKKTHTTRAWLLTIKTKK